ncbi:hypothetical protein HQ520_01470, partial [bacterium]|nr:hypothetical protein [bacterium]
MRSDRKKSAAGVGTGGALTASRPAGQYLWLLGRLDRVRRYLKAVVWIESLAHVVLVLLVTAPTLFVLDNLFHFTTPLRLFGFLILLAGLGAALVASARMAFQHWTYERLALKIEARFPELENRLINAVQLGKMDAGHPAYALVSAIVEDTAREASARRLRDAVDTRSLKKALIVGVALAGMVSLYPLFFGDYFQNAAFRILFPTRAIQPITRIDMRVEPGDATVSRNAGLVVAAVPEGETPRTSYLEIRNDRMKAGFTMDFDGGRFVHELTELREDFRYRVRAGDFDSRWYRVRVVEKPDIENLRVRYEYPGYTRLSPAVIDPFNGNVAALSGTRATLYATLNKPVQQAAFAYKAGSEAPVKRNEEQILEVNLEVKGDGDYEWRLRDAEGHDNSPARIYSIRALPDEAPRVSITSPRGTVEVPRGEELTVLYSASDDYGLLASWVKLEQAGRSENDREQCFEPPRDALNEGYVMRTEGFEPGTEIRLAVVVTDANPSARQPVESDPLIVKIVAPEVKAISANDALRYLFTDLLRILAKQKSARLDLDRWRVMLAAEDFSVQQSAALLGQTLIAQSEIRAETLLLVGAEESAEEFGPEIFGALSDLCEGEMRAAVQALQGVAQRASIEERRVASGQARELQTAIIDRLVALLGKMAEGAPQLEELIPEDEELLKEKDKRLSPSTLADLHGSLLDFMGDQDGLLRSLQSMEDVHPDDLSTTQSQLIENLALQEEEWSEYFKDAANWLRESPMVEGTESG